MGCIYDSIIFTWSEPNRVYFGILEQKMLKRNFKTKTMMQIVKEEIKSNQILLWKELILIRGHPP